MKNKKIINNDPSQIKDGLKDTAEGIENKDPVKILKGILEIVLG